MLSRTTNDREIHVNDIDDILEIRKEQGKWLDFLDVLLLTRVNMQNRRLCFIGKSCKHFSASCFLATAVVSGQSAHFAVGRPGFISHVLSCQRL